MMTDLKDKTEFALTLGRAMNEMKTKIRQKIQEKIIAVRSPLSFELLEIIGILWNRDGISQQEIATILSKDKSSITYLINKLAKMGLVKRLEAPEDRRINHIFLTPEGKKRREKVFPFVLNLYKQAAGDLKMEEIEQAISVVRKMTANLELSNHFNT